jgi:hypothetical protein
LQRPGVPQVPPRVCRAVDRNTLKPVVGLQLCEEDAIGFVQLVKGGPAL